MLKSGKAGLVRGLVLAACVFSLAKVSLADDHSDYIPADTPFYLGTESGFPVDLMLAFSPASNFPVPDDIDGEERELLDSLSEIVNNLDTVLPEWGIGEVLHFSSYAVGIFPVVRVTLDDVEKFNSSLAAVEARHELTPETLERAGYKVRRYGVDSFAGQSVESDEQTKKETDSDSKSEPEGLGIIVATDDKDLIIAAVSNAGGSDLVDRVLGINKPAESIAESGKLADVRKRWDYKDHYASFFDFTLIADMLTSDASLAGKDLTALSERDDRARERLMTMRSELCKAEITGLAENWPMLVMGIRELSYNDDAVQYVSHAASEIAHAQLNETLKLLRGALSTSQSASKALLSVGLGLSVDNLTQFIGQVTNLMGSVNYECPALQGLNRISSTDLSAASMGVVMFGGLARGVEGVSFNIFDIAFSSDGEPEPIKGADLAVVVNAKDPQVLVQTLQMMPQLGMLAELPLDGTEVSLNSMLPIPVPDGVELKAAIKEKNIVIFGGEKSTEYVGRLANNEPGFFRAAIDTANIIDKVTSVMEMIGQDSEQLNDTIEYMKGYPKGHIEYGIDFTDNGVELLSTAVVQRTESSE